MRALEREPDRRFESAAQMADAIQSCGAPVANARRVGAYVVETRAPTASTATASHEGATHATKPMVAEIEDGSIEGAPRSKKRIVVGAIAFAVVAGVVLAAWPRRGDKTTTDAPHASAQPSTPSIASSNAPTSTEATTSATPAIPPPAETAVASSSAQTSPSSKKGAHTPISPQNKPKFATPKTTSTAPPAASEYHPPLL
jgi:hypothetical protein